MQELGGQEQRRQSLSDATRTSPEARLAAPFVGRESSLDWWWALSTVAMGTLFVCFAWANFAHWRADGRPVGLGQMVQELVMALVFVVRRRPHNTSRSPMAWISTGLGTFGMLLARPGGTSLSTLAAFALTIQLVGCTTAVVGLTSLGRAFGLVAAHRGLRTSGPYRFVRHPIYAGYLLTALGYLLENPTLWNFLVVTCVAIFQITRIVHEERLLRADPEYTAYCRRVPYRLIPFVY